MAVTKRENLIDPQVLGDYLDIKLINKIKSRTARLVRRDYPVEVGEYYEKIEFWTNSYYLGSVGSNTTEIVKEYIQNQ